ncbi:hypothetical protein BY458DRAFT_557847 [Sporodiniella umbellata]|nr:hypothetical protein BY458DRAFT_557847 [Sporodiniella umbellata]
MPDPISKAQEEEMSTALIAQLLAQDAYDQGGMDYYEYEQAEDRDGSYEDDSEDEFDPRKKPGLQPKKELMKRGRKRKSSPVDLPKKEPKIKETKSKEPKESIENKKTKKSTSDSYNTGVYTELEEKNFLEGLDMFGRDWSKLQAHVATRDANSIRSHAQKHFIKMFRDNIPLSDKIRETGEGYTLSGKPLDPNSSAAKPYLKAMSSQTIEKLAGQQIQDQQRLPPNTTPKTQQQESLETGKNSIVTSVVQVEQTTLKDRVIEKQLTNAKETQGEIMAEKLETDKSPENPNKVHIDNSKSSEIALKPTKETIERTMVVDSQQAKVDLKSESTQSVLCLKETEKVDQSQTSYPELDHETTLKSPGESNQTTKQKIAQEQEESVSVEKQTEQLTIVENVTRSSWKGGAQDTETTIPTL